MYIASRCYQISKYRVFTVYVFRNGSVEVLTTIVFQAVILPLQSTIQLVLTSNTKTKDTGATVVALGVFELDVSAIDVGELLTVEDNPSPSESQIIGHGGRKPDYCMLPTKAHTRLCINAV